VSVHLIRETQGKIQCRDVMTIVTKLDVQTSGTFPGWLDTKKNVSQLSLEFEKVNTIVQVFYSYDINFILSK
jgi:hypothetical protein